MREHQTAEIVRGLFEHVAQLEALYPGRKFSLDGHTLGSVCEVLVAERYGLTLMPASNKGYDAIDADGRKIEIKGTAAKSFAFRHEPEWVIAVLLHRDATVEEIYNGPGAPVWALATKRRPSGNQYAVTVGQMRKLSEDLTGLR